MNFADIYNKIKTLDEATDPVNGKTPEEAMKDPRYTTDPAFKAEVDRAASIGTPPASAAGKDLGNGFTLTTISVLGRTNLPAVLDTQSNTHWIQNKDPATGGAIIRSPVAYIPVVNGKMSSGQPGGETAAALRAAGLKESINENSNENFMSLYKQIRAIDEGQMPDEMEECGDMMSLPMPTEHGQSDSVTMSVSMNGSGDGGIRDLMNILKGIENVGEPHADHDATDVVFGGEMEPEMEAFANSMAGASEKAYFPQSAVTDIGSNDGRGDHEVRKANGGGNPYTQVGEELVNRLSNLYQEIKEAGDKKTMSRAAKGHEKYGKEGMQALAKAGKEGKDLDKVRDKYNKYDEAYNPNSVDAEHRRGLEKSHEDSLKKKAAGGDESAKKRLQALKDKKERMANDYNDRMER